MNNPITVRWLVRQEIVREPRFGESKPDVLRWVLRQYIQLDRKNRTFGSPTYYRAAGPAIEEARRRCAERYGCAHGARHNHARSRR